MHLPKPNLFGYTLAGVIGLLFIVAAVLGLFGDFMTNLIAAFAGVIALISTVNTVRKQIKAEKENNKKQ